MSTWKEIMSGPQCRYINQSIPNQIDNPLTSFAIDDALAISVGNKLGPPTVRLWVHKPSVILGIPDARLPYLQEAIDWLNDQGVQAIVRNSGGLAVLLDTGVLNMSLILPDVKKIGIHEGYETIVGFIQSIFADVTKDEIQAYEVNGSYCPGDYDLSINGKKFAGISQRRVKNGIAVQIYICVEGNGVERAALVRDFYQRGLKEEKGRFVYPTIIPETMASLNQLLTKTLTVSELVQRIENKLKQLFDSITTYSLTTEEQEWYEERLIQMENRNKKSTR